MKISKRKLRLAITTILSAMTVSATHGRAMRLTRLLLLLLLGALQGSLSQSIHVSQDPVVNATKGSTVTLQCNYTLSTTEKSPFGWYRWYKHVLGGPEVSNDNGYFKDRVSKVTQTDFLSHGLANIQLRDVQPEESGMYICEVEFMLNQSTKGHGNWTFLHVQEYVTENLEDKVIWVSLRLLIVLLITFVSVVMYLLCIRRGEKEETILYY
uniref:Natural cytotoxicity triggering receptor 3 n=1 Tax=Xenopus tropicalis TaxID=8364 RepID=A0A803JQQ3_XENTR